MPVSRRASVRDGAAAAPNSTQQHLIRIITAAEHGSHTTGGTCAHAPRAALGRGARARTHARTPPPTITGALGLDNVAT